MIEFLLERYEHEYQQLSSRPGCAISVDLQEIPESTAKSEKHFNAHIYYFLRHSVSYIFGLLMREGKMI